jgi:hypothetical protein
VGVSVKDGVQVNVGVGVGDACVFVGVGLVGDGLIVIDD